MGSIWEAEERATNAPVALKFLSQTLTTESALRRFRREARALERLQHPHVVKIFASGVDRGLPFIVMELLEGESLRTLADREGNLSPGRTLEFLRHAGLGLAAAHELGIVHRDVKPSNLFVGGEAQGRLLKLIDFGIAKGDPLVSGAESATTGFLGSPAYVSPEQARGEPVDHRADLWSLAVVAFRLLTGREPFCGANVPETLQNVCSGRVPRASASAAALAPFDAFFARAFAPNKNERYSHVLELVEAFESICTKVGDVVISITFESKLDDDVRTGTTRSLAGSPPRSNRGRRLTSAWGLAVLLILSAGAWFVSAAPPVAPAASPTASTALALPITSAAAESSSAALPEVANRAMPTPESSLRSASRARLAPAAAKPGATLPSPSSMPVPERVDLDPTFGLPVRRVDDSRSAN